MARDGLSSALPPHLAAQSDRRIVQLRVSSHPTRTPDPSSPTAICGSPTALFQRVPERPSRGTGVDRRTAAGQRRRAAPATAPRARTIPNSGCAVRARCRRDLVLSTLRESLSERRLAKRRVQPATRLGRRPFRGADVPVIMAVQPRPKQKGRFRLLFLKL